LRTTFLHDNRNAQQMKNAPDPSTRVLALPMRSSLLNGSFLVFVLVWCMIVELAIHFD